MPEEIKLNAGDKVYVETDKRPFLVRAADERFAICTKPAFGTVIYFIADLVEKVRGPENLVFGMGAETDAHCDEMLKRLNGVDRHGAATEISRRKSIPLDIVKIVIP